jgi:acetyl-CoA acetyltransferase
VEDVAIIGVGQTVAPSEPTNLETLIFSTAQKALINAGLEHKDIDGVVTACSDQIDGRAISSMINSGPAGGHLRDEVNIASSGAHALIAGYLAVASGRRKVVLVSSWGKASEGNVRVAEHLTTDPYFDRDLPLTDITAMGMQAQALRSRLPKAEEAAVRVVLKNLGAVGTTVQEEDIRTSPIAAVPLRLAEIAPLQDGAYAIVLAARSIATGGSPRVVVRGVGWAADPYRLPDRDLVGLPNLRVAAGQAYRRANVRTADEVRFFEVHDYCGDAEILACSALGLGDLEDVIDLILAGETEPGGSRPVNASGGSLRGETPFAGGLQKVADAIAGLEVAATAGQDVIAVVQTSAGFAGQFQTVAVLGLDGGPT